MYDNELPDICRNCESYVERTLTITGARTGKVFTYIHCEHALECEKLTNAILEEDEDE